MSEIRKRDDESFFECLSRLQEMDVASLTPDERREYDELVEKICSLPVRLALEGEGAEGLLMYAAERGLTPANAMREIICLHYTRGHLEKSEVLYVVTVYLPYAVGLGTDTPTEPVKKLMESFYQRPYVRKGLEGNVVRVIGYPEFCYEYLVNTPAQAKELGDVIGCKILRFADGGGAVARIDISERMKVCFGSVSS